MHSTPEPAAGERAMLDQFLDVQRETLLRKCRDLDGEQLARRSVPPSSMSLLGLVRHLAKVERWWFRRQMCGMPLAPLHVTREEPDLDFDGVRAEDWEDDLEVYRGEVAAARDAVADLPLDAFAKGTHAQGLSLRWIYLHMIAEYARHNGHADLLRERVDGRTGL
jgi:uncharacterized damage-inducible protein DinB